MTATKTITLSFQIPANVDTSSEDLSRMRDLLMEAAAEILSKHPCSPKELRWSNEDKVLLTALLTES